MGIMRVYRISFMKIGVFSYRLPLEGQKRGGIERVAHDLAQSLAARGHDVLVWSHDPAPANARYRVAELPWKSLTNRPWGRRIVMGYLGNLLPLVTRTADRDVLILHGDSVLAGLTGKPVLRVFHGSALDEALSATSFPRRFAQLGVYAGELVSATLARASVAVSSAAKRRVPWIRHVIHNGVDRQRFHPAPGSKTPQPSLLFVGAPGGRKRGASLVRWFLDEVRPRHPDATLDLVSPPGPGGAGVRYLEGVSDDKLVSLYQRSWILASPSRYEGFGLPLVEAMACGTAVVATPNDGSREILGEGRHGLLAADSEFGRRINDLIEDESLRRDFERRGVERAAEFDLSRIAVLYENLLRSLAGDKGEPS